MINKMFLLTNKWKFAAMLFPQKRQKDFLGHMMIRAAKVFDCMKELLLSFFFSFPLKDFTHPSKT